MMVVVAMAMMVVEMAMAMMDNAEGDGLGQKLHEDVPAMRAHGRADADLAGPLGHAHEHDIHDADAADEQGDAGQGAEQEREHLRSGGGHFGDLLLAAHGEIIDAAHGDVMALAEEGRDLLHRFRHSLLQDSRWSLHTHTVWHIGVPSFKLESDEHPQCAAWTKARPWLVPAGTIANGL